MGYNRIPLALLMLRLSVFFVMLVWTLGKFFYPAHIAQVFGHLYFMSDLSLLASCVFGGIELVIILAFLFGVSKTLSYGLVLIIQAVATLASYQQYFAPYQGDNLLFFATWPMLAACFALYYLRELDTLWVYKRTRRMF